MDIKNKYIIFYKAKRAACKGSKSRSLTTPVLYPTLLSLCLNAINLIEWTVKKSHKQNYELENCAPETRFNFIHGYRVANIIQ